MACAQLGRFGGLTSSVSLRSSVVRPSVQRRLMAVNASGDKAASIKQTIADNKVVVFSKTHCPYCRKVKGLMSDLKLPAQVVEIDLMSDGPEFQSTLQGISGMRTVPQVFVGGNLVGGCDDTVAAYQSGKLKEVLAAAGLSI